MQRHSNLKIKVKRHQTRVELTERKPGCNLPQPRISGLTIYAVLTWSHSLLIYIKSHEISHKEEESPRDYLLFRVVALREQRIGHNAVFLSEDSFRYHELYRLEPCQLIKLNPRSYEMSMGHVGVKNAKYIDKKL